MHEVKQMNNDPWFLYRNLARSGGKFAKSACKDWGSTHTQLSVVRGNFFL